MTQCNQSITRRDFLFASASLVTFASIPSLDASVQQKQGYYPEEKIVQIARLRPGEVYYFEYPQKSGYMCMLVRLNTSAGGGVGPKSDVVSFHTMCTHMGRQLIGKYMHEHATLGPCPVHFSVFDLARYGMLTSGQATQSLPQVILEHRESWIYAQGFSQLIYGRHANL